MKLIVIPHQVLRGRFYKMSTDKYHNRTALLNLFMDKKFSVYVGNEIMNLFGNIKPEQKEIVAQQAIPLVKQSKTEQEALNKIKQLIEQG